MTRAEEDFDDFVQTVAPPCDNSMIAIIIRFSFKQYFLALRRLFFSLKEGKDHIKCCVIPSKDLYHHKASGLTLAADLPHKIFCIGLKQHLAASEVSEIRPTAFEVSKASEDAIITDNLDFNGIMEYICWLSSYPVLPPDICGTIRSSMFAHEPYKEIDIISPGIDNRANVKTPWDPRVCVRCKINNLTVGQTDLQEQAKRTFCRCVFEEVAADLPFLEALILIRATMLTRINQLSNLGCSCSSHKNLFQSKLSEYVTICLSNKR